LGEGTVNRNMVDDLRQRLARGDYAVDPHRVAGSLVEKMRLIRAARRRLETPPRDPRDHV
jgi:hypothetical protein